VSNNEIQFFCPLFLPATAVAAVVVAAVVVAAAVAVFVGLTEDAKDLFCKIDSRIKWGLDSCQILFNLYKARLNLQTTRVVYDNQDIALIAFP